MAYSWLSHCKRYLELLEGEKRFLRNYKVQLLLTRKMSFATSFVGWPCVASIVVFVYVRFCVCDEVRHSWCLFTVFLTWRPMLSQCWHADSCQRPKHPQHCEPLYGTSHTCLLVDVRGYMTHMSAFYQTLNLDATGQQSNPVFLISFSVACRATWRA